MPAPSKSRRYCRENKRKRNYCRSRLCALFNNLSRKKTLVSLYNPQTKERWEEVVMPISNGAFNELLYTRWVKQRAADVDKWSGGR